MNRRSFLKGMGFAFAAGTLGAPRAFAIADQVTPLVDTTGGMVLGLLDGGIHTFCGIPYAAPPIGALRFMPPQKPEPRTGVIDALRFGHSAMQLSSGGGAATYPGAVGPALGQVFGSRGDILIQGEDCLVLNVWTPEVNGASKRPVMVWFHGGGFNYGSGSWPAYDGHNLAKNHDIVVVTVNHRLNAFGYLNLAEIGGEKYAQSGNAGQLDLVASLEWVRDNIANFGGDSTNVTIFGQSGGGAKVCNLMAMPSAKGLFHKAIVQSGTAIESGSPEKTAEVARAVLDKLQITADTIESVHLLHADDILAAAVAVSAGSTERAMRFGPIMDGAVIANHPFEPVASPLGAEIPVMVGCTKDEMTLYNVGSESWRIMTDAELLPKAAEAVGDKAEALLAAYRTLHPDNAPRYLYTDVLTTRHFLGTVTLAERKAAQNAAPVYHYVWDWEAPVDDHILKAPHTMEIPFVFDNVDKGPILLGREKATSELGKKVSAVWVAFARTGNPNTKSITGWTPYNAEARATMRFNNESEVVNDHQAEVRKLMQA